LLTRQFTINRIQYQIYKPYLSIGTEKSGGFAKGAESEPHDGFSMPPFQGCMVLWVRPITQGFTLCCWCRSFGALLFNYKRHSNAKSAENLYFNFADSAFILHSSFRTL